MVKNTTGRPCKECDPESKRPAPYPGPRCFSHHKREMRRRQAKAHATRIERTYSISAERYAELYALQGGVCALCRRATGATKRLAIDHDHGCCPGPTSCGKCVRGLLCSNCNSVLAHARDAREFFVRALLYLTHPPAQGGHLIPAKDPS